MEQNKLYGSRIPRAPKRALKSLSENEVHAKTGGNGAGGNHENQLLKKPRLEESKAGGADGGLDTEWLEMSEKNGLNIDSLLGMRMTGKGKWDHKGRCEQMMPYIKQLRACTRYLRSCVAKADGIKQNLIDAHEKNLSERETELEKLNEQLAELDKQCESSKDTISTMKGKVNEMKKELEDKHEVEMQQKVEISTLSNELSHEKKVVSEKNEEITKIQDNYIKSQEYAQNLQDFVKKLKEDTQKMNDSLLKIQEEKADLVNDLNLSRGNAAQLEEKLQGSKELVEQLQKQKNELDETLEAMKEQHSKSIEEMATSFKEKEAEAKENFEKLKSEKNQKEEELKSIEVKHKDVCEALEGCEKELNLKITSLQELDSKCSGLENTIQENKVRYESELKVRIDEAQAEKESFEEAKASLESSLEEKNAELSQIGSLLADSEIKLQELSNNFEKTKIELQACQDELSGKENECQTLNSELEKAHVELDDYQKTKTVLQACQDELSSKVSECQAMSSELEKAQGELGKYQQITGQSAENMEKLMQKSQQLQDQNSSQNEVLEAIKAQYEIVKQKLSLCEVQNNALQEEHQSTMSELQMKETLLKEADQQIHEGEMLRRKLHNQILELKGNIRVFCRTRPLSEEETNLEGCQNVPTISYTSKGEKIGKGLQLHLTTNKQSKKRSSNGESHYNFDFDRAFQENASQEEIFEEISQLVQSALDGYKVCIFAYGQTGSGKTHTMIGNPSCPGMIPRSLEQIFTSAEKMKDQGWKYSISVSMLEIYNEEYKDLLGKKLPAGKQHTVKHDQQGKTSVSYMTDVKVTSMEKVNTLLNKAMSVRSVAATQCNEHSSRSHFVFRLNIEGSNDTLGQTVNGVLNLVDLAGSERLSKSQATGDRLKETQNINKSLSALGDVILSINNGDSHIPYRNSKLTWLLQPCLGNQSKALMFVNIAPSQEAAQETLCSLRFASKVNACEIGTAKRYVS